MNFTRFLGSSTNVFPIANSKTGGQLLTEFNLRSRESVITTPEVKYHIGPSCTHSMDDFKPRWLEDELGTVISKNILEITSGRALVNGHYLESLVNVTIDMGEANNQLKTEGQLPLTGKLAVGLRAMYSTEQTLAATMLTENNQNFIEGMQIVILPIGKIEPGYFVLPQDSPDDESLVTAHLKLAEFIYLDGNIRSIVHNEGKVQYIPASRIGDFGSLLSGTYITRNGLNPKKLYTFSGKAPDPNSNMDTWCDSTDSLFIWQKASDLKTTLDPQLDQAEFGYDSNDYITLTLPHKHVDGMTDLEGHTEYYMPRIMSLPKANWSANTPGTIDGNYTRSIKAIKEQLNEIYRLPNGKQVGYLEELDEDRTDMPTLNPEWNIGDYIVVCQDSSVVAKSDVTGAPSTFYTVLPPIVTSVEYFETRSDSIIPSNTRNGKLTGIEIHREETTFNPVETYDLDYVISVLSPLYENEDDYNDRLGVNSSGYRGQENLDYICVRIKDVPTPREFADTDKTDVIDKMKELSDNIHTHTDAAENLKLQISSYEESLSVIQDSIKTLTDQIAEATSYIAAATSENEKNTYKNSRTELEKQRKNLQQNTTENKNSNNVEAYNTLITKARQDLANETSILKTYTDRIALHNIVVRDWNSYFVVKSTDNKKAYSTPNILTGSIPLATEDRIGGFLNVTDTAIDNGYIYRDDDGHLRLLDYGLLRSGVLAYQLSEDQDFGVGLSTEELQTELNEYVNDRVAFPSFKQSQKEIYPNMIELTLSLPEETEYSQVTIQNIDSRWGTGVWLHITGNGNPHTTINVLNCEKIKIDIEGGTPVINIYNSGVYYDADLIDYVRSCERKTKSEAALPTFDASYLGYIYPDDFTGIENMSIWYEKFDSDDPNFIVDGMTITETDAPVIPEDVDFWSESVVNDNHYYFGLQSLTFAPNGNLAGCGIYMRNDMSANIELTKSIAAASFRIPQGSALTYPLTSVIQQIKITGDFTTAYPTTSPDGYITMSTQFTALSQYKNISQIENEDGSIDDYLPGTISFLSDAQLIDNIIGVELGTPIDGWESNSYHVFKGWTIG